MTRAWDTTTGQLSTIELRRVCCQVRLRQCNTNYMKKWFLRGVDQMSPLDVSISFG